MVKVFTVSIPLSCGENPSKKDQSHIASALRDFIADVEFGLGNCSVTASDTGKPRFEYSEIIRNTMPAKKHNCNTSPKTAYGEPLQLCFNISHSRSMVCVAFAYRELGVDVEFMRERTNILQIAARFFHPEEYNRLQKTQGQKRIETFYRIWTLKESYLKCVGMGIGEDLRGFSVFEPLSHQGCELNSFTIQNGTYCISVCSFDSKINKKLIKYKIINESNWQYNFKLRI
ncbi:MAG: 4'-phosphopantetheinyl transferase superfamily protein [Spirochaetes bacterium]|jgi:phosphopantetheine--protein transferase-like protein|nr:4'-phosphopantetheinyl transferase superfamily protein [Spirochaetota bacterium]